MDAKCYITSCEILDIGSSIVNELAYGIDCETVKYCNFARYYIEADLQQLPIINNGEPDIDNPDPYEPPTDPDIPEVIIPPIIPPIIIIGTVTYETEYIDYQCVVLSDSSTTTTTTTIIEECEINPTIDEIIELTTTTTSTTTTTTTTV